MRPRFRHPSPRQLEAWLSNAAPTFDAHVATCNRCATKLEELSRPTASVSEALRSMLTPPEDLQQRLRSGIERKLQARQDLHLLAELIGLPWQTAQALRANPSTDD